MADVDTSIYNKFLPPPTAFDPMKTFGQVVGIQNAQQQNKLLQQTQDLRSGMTDAFKAAVDPTNGQVDQNKLLGIVSQDPRTAWNFGDVNQQTQANVTATAQAQQEQLKNAQAHVEAANGYISATLGNPALGKTDQYDTIVKTINDMWSHNANLGTPAERDALIAQVPKGDPIGQKQFVLNAANQNFAIQRKLEPLLAQGYGTPVQINTGPTVVGGTQASPTQGGALNVPQQPGVPMGLTPGEKTGQLPAVGSPGVGADGNPLPPVIGSVSVGSQFDRYGNPIGQGTGAGSAGAATGASRATGTAPPAPVTGSPSSFRQTQLTPGTGEAATSVAKSSGDTLAADRAYQGGNATRTYQAQTAIQALRSTGTGPGSEWRQNVVSTALALPLAGPVLAKLGVLDPKSIEAYDEANKLMARTAADQLTGTGAPSDARQGLITTANASTHISNAAAQQVLYMNIGLDRMKSAGVAAFDKTGLPPDQYAKWISGWNKTQDPRAYYVDQMPSGERSDFIAKMNETERTKYLKSGADGVALGYIPHAGTMQ